LRVRIGGEPQGDLKAKESGCGQKLARKILPAPGELKSAVNEGMKGGNREACGKKILILCMKSGLRSVFFGRGCERR
jgi:hypothetical protein